MVGIEELLRYAALGSFLFSLVFGLMFMTSTEFVISEYGCNETDAFLNNPDEFFERQAACDDEQNRVISNSGGEVCVVGRLGIFNSVFDPSCADGTAYEIPSQFPDFEGRPQDFPLLFPAQTALSGLASAVLPTGSFESTFDRNCTKFFSSASLDLVFGAFANLDLGNSVFEVAQGIYDSYSLNLANSIFSLYSYWDPFFGELNITGGTLNLTEFLPSLDNCSSFGCDRLREIASDFSLTVLNVDELLNGQTQFPATYDFIPTESLFDSPSDKVCTFFGLSDGCLMVDVIRTSNSSAVALVNSYFASVVQVATSLNLTDLLPDYSVVNETFLSEFFVGSLNVSNVSQINAFRASITWEGTIASFTDFEPADMVPENLDDNLALINPLLSGMCAAFQLGASCTFPQLVEIALATTVSQQPAAPSENVLDQVIFATRQKAILGLSLYNESFYLCESNATLAVCFQQTTLQPLTTLNTLNPAQAARIEILSQLYDVDAQTLEGIQAQVIEQCEDDELDKTALDYAQMLVPSGYCVVVVGFVMAIIMFKNKANSLKCKELAVASVALCGAILQIFALYLVSQAPVYAEVGVDGPVDDGESVYVNGIGYTYALLMIAFSVLAGVFVLVTGFFGKNAGDGQEGKTEVKA